MLLKMKQYQRLCSIFQLHRRYSLYLVSTKQNDVTLTNEQVNDQALAIMRLVG